LRFAEEKKRRKKIFFFHFKSFIFFLPGAFDRDKIRMDGTVFSTAENIKRFIQVCKNLGVKDVDLLLPDDLLKNNNLKVAQSLVAIRQVMQPDYVPRMPDEKGTAHSRPFGAGSKRATRAVSAFFPTNEDPRPASPPPSAETDSKRNSPPAKASPPQQRKSVATSSQGDDQQGQSSPSQRPHSKVFEEGAYLRPGFVTKKNSSPSLVAPAETIKSGTKVEPTIGELVSQRQPIKAMQAMFETHSDDPSDSASSMAEIPFDFIYTSHLNKFLAFLRTKKVKLPRLGPLQVIAAQ